MRNQRRGEMIEVRVTSGLTSTLGGRCEFLEDCDPGETHPRECQKSATSLVELSYRHGDNVEVRAYCAFHAEARVHALNAWGYAFGHKARHLNRYH